MDNTILIKNALILNPNNFENKKQSLLIKDDLIAEISDEIDECNHQSHDRRQQHRGTEESPWRVSERNHKAPSVISVPLFADDADNWISFFYAYPQW